MSVLDLIEDIEQTAEKGNRIEYENEKPLIIRIYETLTNKYDFRLNDISKKIEFKHKEKETWEMIADENVNTFWIEFQLNKEFKGKEKPSDGLIFKLINSHLTIKYNAVHDYFNNLKYDGKDYFKEYCKTYSIEPIKLIDGSDIIDHWQSLFKTWLISAVSCMLGHSPNHVMLVLMGGQGIGKTTHLNNLCPPHLNKDYRVTGHIKPDLNDGTTANYLAEKVWINIDDQLDQIFGKEFNSMKSLITIDKINNRKTYARFETSRPRIANFVGSVNQDRIFIDSENRRYLSFKVTKLNYINNIDINGLWAQIYYEYKQGARAYFSSQQVNIINMINNQFAKIPPEQEYFNLCYETTENYTYDCKYIQFSEILSTIKQASGLNMRENILTVVLKKLNIRPISKRINNMPRYVYLLREKFVREASGKIKLQENN